VTGTRDRVEVEETVTPRPSWGRWFFGIAALALVFLAFFLPLWRSALQAPQYPEGLTLIVYGDRAEGDLAEIDSLNHYIGMQPLRVEEMPELALWPVGVAVGALAALIGALTSGWARRLSLLYLWVFPVGILAVIQYRLHQFGHDLDPAAAFRMDGFTPWVIGPTRVWNFTAWSMPGTGIFLLLLAAALVTFGPRLFARLSSRRRTGPLTTAILLMVLLMALPATAQTDHSHHGPDHPAGEPAAPSVGGDDSSPITPVETDFDQSALIDLSALIAGVPDGGTLSLQPGTYSGDLVIERPIHIEGTELAVIVGSGTGTVLTVAAPGTTIRGVHVTGSGAGPSGAPAGIRIAADEVEIEGVIVSDSYIGVAIDGVSRARVVDGLILGRAQAAIGGEGHAVDGSHDHGAGGRGDGISIWDSEGVLIRGTRIQDVRDGVYVSFGSSVLIDSNQISDSRYAVHTMYSRGLVLIENTFRSNLSAAVIMYGGEVDVVRNLVAGNMSPSTGFGIILKDVTEAEVIQNVISANRVGVHIDGPAGGQNPIAVTANTIADNQFGVVVYPSASATFLANSFVDNLVQVSQQGRGAGSGVTWSDLGWGNYWSTYQGYENGQGRGATPHAEASSANRVLIRSPLLAAVATSPAMKLIEAVETRWLQRAPVAVDELPLVSPVSPPMPASDPQPAAVAASAIAGVLFAAAAGFSFLRLSRPRARGALA
jgi:parallel beta-helix repeat protein